MKRSERPLPGGRSGLALAVAIGVSSALSFAVHALSSRELSVADYGGLAAVLALMTAAAVPVGAVQTALTRSAVEILAHGGRPSGRDVLRQVLPAVALITAAAAILAPATARFLSLSSPAPVVLAGAWIGVVLVGAIGKAMLIAGQTPAPVAHALVHGAIIRLVAVAFLTPAFGVTGGIAAALVGDVVASAVYVAAAARRGLLDADREGARVLWPDAGRALSAQLSLWLFASLAVVVGRRTLNGATSGSFAAMSTAAVACLFLPQAVATIVFPRFVADGSQRLLLRATALAAVVGTACAVAISARPDWIFVMFFGPAYAPRRGVLLVLCMHFVLLGCLTVLSQYLVARRQAGALANWVALVFAALTAARYGHSPMSVAVALLAPTIGVTAYVAVRTVTRPHPTASGDTPRSRSAASNLTVRPAGERLREPATLDVSVVIPTYNGGARLRPCVEAMRDALDATAWRYEIIVSDDGSTDSSSTRLELGPTVIVDRSPINLGKGSALRRGFAGARGSVIGFIDGDGDIAPHVLIELVERLQASGAWLAVASKNQPGATVSATRRRRLMSAGYRLLVHWMFDLEVTDTQCGCKAFRRRFIADTIDQARESGFAFDLELLTIGSRAGMKRAVEVPVVLCRAERGTISGRTALRVLFDTLRIRRRLPMATWAPLQLSTLAPVGVDFSSPLLP